jgi:hypothetical protein
VAFVGLALGVLFLALKVAGVLRVSPQVELAGVDLVLHGTTAYVGMITDKEDGTPAYIDDPKLGRVSAAETVAGD